MRPATAKGCPKRAIAGSRFLRTVGVVGRWSCGWFTGESGCGLGIGSHWVVLRYIGRGVVVCRECLRPSVLNRNLNDLICGSIGLNSIFWMRYLRALKAFAQRKHTLPMKPPPGLRRSVSRLRACPVVLVGLTYTPSDNALVVQLPMLCAVAVLGPQELGGTVGNPATRTAHVDAIQNNCICVGLGIVSVCDERRCGHGHTYTPIIILVTPHTVSTIVMELRLTSLLHV